VHKQLEGHKGGSEVVGKTKKKNRYQDSQSDPQSQLQQGI
jgi:hypothetical protein